MSDKKTNSPAKTTQKPVENGYSKPKAPPPPPVSQSVPTFDHMPEGLKKKK